MPKGKIGNILFSRIFQGEDLTEAIKKRVEENKIKAGIFNLIGSLERAVLGYYRKGEYHSIKLDGPLEIASCMGNISVTHHGKIIVHAHIIVANDKGEAFGGHLMKDSIVGATAELVIIEACDVNLLRALDKKTRLNLWKEDEVNQHGRYNHN